MKRRPPSFVCLLLLANAFLFLATSVAAEDRGGEVDPSDEKVQQIEMAYEFHMGPLHVLSIEATLKISDSDYELTSLGETRGITDLLFNMVNETRSLGERRDDDFEPTFYRQASDSRWGEWMVEMVYENGDIARLTTDPKPEDEGVIPVSAEDRMDTVDPMAAFLLGARRAKPGECERTIDVFDGRRRYDLEFGEADPAAVEDARRKNLPEDGNFFWCQLEFKRVSGFEAPAEEPDPEEAVERRGNEPVVMLLGHFDDNAITLPIYGRIKSPFGTARSELTDLRIDGVALFEDGKRPPNASETSPEI